MSLLLVQTHTGLKALSVKKINLENLALNYVDPTYPVRPRLSTIYRHTDGTYHVAGFEDPMDPGAISGRVLGTLALEIPGVNFNP